MYPKHIGVVFKHQPVGLWRHEYPLKAAPMHTIFIQTDCGGGLVHRLPRAFWKVLIFRRGLGLELGSTLGAAVGESAFACVGDYPGAAVRGKRGGEAEQEFGIGATFRVAFYMLIKTTEEGRLPNTAAQPLQ